MVSSAVLRSEFLSTGGDTGFLGTGAIFLSVELKSGFVESADSGGNVPLPAISRVVALADKGGATSGTELFQVIALDRDLYQRAKHGNIQPFHARSMVVF